MTATATTQQGATAQLARFAAEVDPSTASVAERLPWLVVDNAAAALIGSLQPWYAAVLDTVHAIGSSGDCVALGSPTPVDAPRAALLLGVAVGGFEAGHGTGGAQQSASVFPAVFALAQMLKSNGPDLLAAMAVGYEVTARVAAAQTNKAEAERGFHNPSISGVFGAASGCARLLGLNAAQTASALGIAGSSASGLIEFVWNGALTKRIHLGRAAQLGLEAALLAQHGITGPETVLEGAYGYLRAYSPSPKPDLLTDGLGSAWLINGIFPKPYPTHGTNQPIVAALDAWHRGGGEPSAVAAMKLLVASDAAEPRHIDRAPTTVLGAQYSVPFTSAVALVHGATGVCELNADTLIDTEVRAVAQSLELDEDPRFRNKAMRHGAEVHLAINGTQTILKGPGLGPVSTEDLRAISLRNLATYAGGTQLDVDAIAAIAGQLTVDATAVDLAIALSP